jgi:hypothetical protein
LEKSGYPGREHENGDTPGEPDDAKDQARQGDAVATEHATALNKQGSV